MKFPIPNSKFQKLLGTTILFFFFLFTANQVFAICEGPLVPCGRAGYSPCQFCHIFVLFNNIVNFILTCLAPIVGGLMLIIGGLYLLISGASPKSFENAKSAITAAVVGLVIIFVSWVLLNTLFTYLGVAEWTGLESWWEIQCP